MPPATAEVLRLQRQKRDLGLKLPTCALQHFVQAREALSKLTPKRDMLAAILKVTRGFRHLPDFRIMAPMRGIVKISASPTIGGMLSRPTARWWRLCRWTIICWSKPACRARGYRVHPSCQRALVKITACDYAIYGGPRRRSRNHLTGQFRIKWNRKSSITAWFIRTHQVFFTEQTGTPFLHRNGHDCHSGYKTGEKTIVDYLIKPFNRPRKVALRER